MKGKTIQLLKIWCYLLLITFVCLGCASLKITPDFGHELPPISEEEKITKSIYFTLSKIERNLTDGRVKEVIYTEDLFYVEREAIKEFGLFENPIFFSQNESNVLNSHIEVIIIKENYHENCYMGGCLFWPNTHRKKITIVLKVINSKNDKIFEFSESATGELWGNVFKIVYGLNPLRTFEAKYTALLLKRGLYSFKSSDSFKVFVANLE